MDKRERTSTDKKRERRKKKNRQRAIHHHLDSKAKKDLENKKGSKALNEKELIEKVSKEKNVTKVIKNTIFFLIPLEIEFLKLIYTFLFGYFYCMRSLYSVLKRNCIR